MHKARPFLWVAFAATGAILLWWGLQPNAQSDAGTPGSAGPIPVAPDFALSNRTGQTVRLADLRGKPVFINFWATWCVPCRSELPMLADLYDKHKDDMHFLFVSIDTDWDDVNEFLNAEGLDIPVLLDRDTQVADSFNAPGWPTTVVLNDRHEIVGRYVGELTEQAARELIREALGTDLGAEATAQR